MTSGIDGDESVSEVLAELAEAEAAEAEALAEAARSRAVAEQLRGSPTGPPLSRRARIAARGAVVLTVASLLATGLMLWQHGRANAQRAHDRQFVAAARDGVVALLSIDHTTAKADVARVLELSTGAFKEEFSKGAEDFVTTAEKSKAVTKGSVSAAALEQVNGNDAVVLLAVTTQVTNAAGARQDPRAFRMSVKVSPDGDQLKMSDVEFVP